MFASIMHRIDSYIRQLENVWKDRSNDDELDSCLRKGYLGVEKVYMNDCFIFPLGNHIIFHYRKQSRWDIK